MRIEPSHIIEKIQVDIDVGSIAVAEKIKGEINDFIKNEVMPLIEACFEEVEKELGEQIVQLDKMELSVDTSSWNIHSNQLKQEIRSEVEKQMKPILEQVRDKKRLPKESFANQSQSLMTEKLQLYGEDERILKSFFHFLEEGTLPWWNHSLEESRQLFSENVLLTAIRQNADLVKRELDFAPRSDRFHERLIQQFPLTVVTAIMSIRLSGVALEKRDAEAIREFRNLSGDVSKKVLALLWQLSNNKTRTALLENEVSSLLFKHIHAQFYRARLDAEGLNAALSTTYSALQFLYVVSNRNEQQEKIAVRFIEALNDQTSEEVLDRLTRTETYRQLAAISQIEIPQSLDQTQNQSEEKVVGSEHAKFIEESTKTDDLASITPANDEVLSRDKVHSKGDQEQSKDVTNESVKRDSEDTVSRSEKHDEAGINEVESTRTQRGNLKEELADSEAQGIHKDPIADHSITTSSPENDAKKGEKNETPSKESESHRDGLDSVKAEENSAKSEIQPLVEDKTLVQNEKADQIDAQIKKTLKPSDEESREAATANKVDAANALSDINKESKNHDFTETSADSIAKSKKDLMEKESSESDMVAGNSAKPDTHVSKSKEDDSPLQEQGIDQKERIQKALSDLTADAPAKVNKADLVLPDYLFVNNAGLVLLNPFLPALFKQLELLSESGKLVDPELAACVLHYAATGREGDFEFEMIFEKYLCGLHPSETLNRAITLTELQKEEVTKVLNAALNYWEVMKNKPIALLQNEFLMRPGKLITEKTNHRLVIERKTFDLLLDKLPWSYSMIKFSWKKELIFVEW